MATRKSNKDLATPALPPASYVRDLDTIGVDARSATQRRASLRAALANHWAADDIDTIERIDRPGWHGFAMWPRA